MVVTSPLPCSSCLPLSAIASESAVRFRNKAAHLFTTALIGHDLLHVVRLHHSTSPSICSLRVTQVASARPLCLDRPVPSGVMIIVRNSSSDAYVRFSDGYSKREPIIYMLRDQPRRILVSSRSSGPKGFFWRDAEEFFSLSWLFLLYVKVAHAKYSFVVAGIPGMTTMLRLEPRICAFSLHKNPAGLLFQGLSNVTWTTYPLARDCLILLSTFKFLEHS